MCKTKFETNPLVEPRLKRLTLNLWGNHHENISLYKKSIGEDLVTATGERLPEWLTSDRLFARIKRLLRGIVSTQVTCYNVSIEYYYEALFNELAEELHHDFWWKSTNSSKCRSLWKRCSYLIKEVTENELEVEIPELVTYFVNLNFQRPNGSDLVKS